MADGVSIPAWCERARLIKLRWVIHRPASLVTMGHAQQVPHLSMCFFFFTHLSSLSSSSSISSSSFSSLTHRWLPTTATDDIITPSQTLCCGESYCTSRFSPLGSSASQQDRPKCYLFIHKILLKSLKRSSLDAWLLMFVAWVTSSILTFIL